MIYPIAVYGHPVLRKIAKEIEPEHEGLSDIIKNMWETMYESDGIGLAAPQVNKSIRLIVIDASPLADDFPELKDFKKVIINPEIVDFNEENALIDEGCLSLPTIREEVKRPTQITIKYFDTDFNPVEETYHDFAARVVQHEYDHLEGKLFVDHLSPLKKRLLKGKLNKISKGDVDVEYRILTAPTINKGKKR